MPDMELSDINLLDRDRFAQGVPHEYRVIGFDAGSGTFAGGEPPEWIIVQESPLRMYSWVPDTLRQVLTHYRLRQAFRGMDVNGWHVFDQQDAFYLPLAGFDSVGRPGPNLLMYQRVDRPAPEADESRASASGL